MYQGAPNAFLFGLSSQKIAETGGSNDNTTEYRLILFVVLSLLPKSRSLSENEFKIHRICLHTPCVILCERTQERQNFLFCHGMETETRSISPVTLILTFLCLFFSSISQKLRRDSRIVVLYSRRKAVLF